MSKKILLIIGIVAIVGIAVFLVLGVKPKEEAGGNGGFSFRDYLPFGRSDDNTGTTPIPIDPVPKEMPGAVINNNQKVPRLRKISNEPVAGGIAFNVGTTTVVRFVEKGTGNVYEARSDKNSIERLTNTTIPKIIRASWLPNGSGFLAQTLLPESEIIETSFVKLNKNSATTSVESLTPYKTTISKLPTNIKEISIKPDSAKIFYYTINGSVSNWYTANPDGTGSALVLIHSLTEWLPKWISGSMVIMQTRGSSGAEGYTYSFNVSSKSLKKVGVGASGISSQPSPDGLQSLVSSGLSPQIFLVDNKTASVVRISGSTLAEKCVWRTKEAMAVYCAMPNQIPPGNYPDNWYKGVVSFEDSIRKIDLKNDVFYNTSDLSNDSNQKIDVANLNLPPDDSHLIFQNKIDGYLWMLRVEE